MKTGLFKKIKGLFRGKSQNVFNNLDLVDRMDFEWEARSQGGPLQLIGSPQFSLLDLLKAAGYDLAKATIQRCYVVTDDWSSKAHRKIEHVEGYNVFDDLLAQNAQGQWRLMANSRNVIIYIGYQEDDNDRFLCLHMRCKVLSGEGDSFRVRLSVVQKECEQPNATATKYLLVFDTKDPSRQIAKIKSLQKTAYAKLRAHKELNELEDHSVNAYNNIAYYRFYGEKRMAEQRWGDAVSDLVNAHQMMKYSYMTGQVGNEALPAFCDVYYRLGLCYFNRHLYAKASVFFELPNIVEPKSLNSQHYQECLRALHDVRADGPTTQVDGNYAANTLLSLLLKSCFDVLPTELSNLLWVDNDTFESGNISKQSEIWNIDIQSLLDGHNNLSLYVSYRATKAIIDDEYLDPNKDYTIKQPENQEFKVNENYLRNTTQACIDKSICRVDNEIVVALSKKGDTGTMTIIVPTFLLSDNNHNQVPQALTVNFALSPNMTEQEFENLRSRAEQKNQQGEELTETEYYSLGELKQAHYAFLQGKAAFENHLFGDALFYLTTVYSTISTYYHTNQTEDVDLQMMGETCYMLGYIYCELQQFEMSIFYLEIIAESGNITWTIEYINSLVNSKDLRAFGFINNELKELANGDRYKELDEDERRYYTNFLRRRYGYILIDMERISEAKEYFTQLLSEPDSRDFAQRELNYIAENFPGY